MTNMFNNRDWNYSLTDYLISVADGAEDSVANGCILGHQSH